MTVSVPPERKLAVRYAAVECLEVDCLMVLVDGRRPRNHAPRKDHRGVVFTFQPGTVDQRVLASPTWSPHQNQPTRLQQAGLQLRDSTRFHSSTHATLLPRCQTLRTTGTRSIIRTRIKSARLPAAISPRSSSPIACAGGFGTVRMAVASPTLGIISGSRNAASSRLAGM